MSMQSEYYDPDTGIIHISDIFDFSSLGANTPEGRELGLQNTSFNDVKMKILSIQYKVQLYSANGTSQGAGDFNDKAFSKWRTAYGSVIFGVANKTGDPADIKELDDYTGTSAWPVHFDMWQTQVGKTTTVSKLWKPKKLAFSSEQVATINLRSDILSEAAPYALGFMYIRGVRL